MLRPSEREYYPTIVATDFSVGINRIPFVLTDIEGNYLDDQEVLVKIWRIQDSVGHVPKYINSEYHEIQSKTAHLHEDGSVHEHNQKKGFYLLANVDIENPGLWSAEFFVESKRNVAIVQQAFFEVRESAMTIGVGEYAPLTNNSVLEKGVAFSSISSRNVDTDNLHELSVNQAIKTELPLMLVFASPRFCVSALCAPVVDLVEEVQDEFGQRANFIHIEPWELSIARSEGRLITSVSAREWNLPSEPWIFLVGSDGRVRAKFEGPTSEFELTEALLKLL